MGERFLRRFDEASTIAYIAAVWIHYQNAGVDGSCVWLAHSEDEK
jgi:hypothetical protein